MADNYTVTLPDVGDFTDIEIIEVLIAVGDDVDKEQSIIVLESDKATMEIPSPVAGRVASIAVKVGDKVNQGDQIAQMSVAAGGQPAADAAEKPAQAETGEVADKSADEAPAVESRPAQQQGGSGDRRITLPDVGDFSDIEIIEVLVSVGDEVEAEQSIIVLESDKATMEIPSPAAGTVQAIAVKVGDKVNEGDEIATLRGAGDDARADTGEPSQPAASSAADGEQAAPPSAVDQPSAEVESRSRGDTAPGKTQRPHPGGGGDQPVPSGKTVHASPSVRRYARELGVDLQMVIGSGPKERILKSDVKSFVKSAMTGAASAAPAAGGIAVAPMAPVDHAKFGDIEVVPLSRIKKLSGAHLHRSWVTVPHVTQFDEADITELEAFRKSLAAEAERKGLRMTPLIFLMKAVVAALREYPDFNASLDASGENLVMKKYFHLGIAVDTPNGLVVPVVRDVDRKGLFDLAEELGELSVRAREGKLTPGEMQGGCFTISSLGGIGGTQFTPIVNAPEVAILGVSRSKMQPQYIDGEFQPRMMLPFGLSYDHRVIDGAQAARFTSFLARVISDIRRVLL